MKLSAYVEVLNKKIRKVLKRKITGRAIIKNISVVVSGVLILLFCTSNQQYEVTNPMAKQSIIRFTQQVLAAQMAMQNYQQPKIAATMQTSTSTSTSMTTTSTTTATTTTTTVVTTTAIETTTIAETPQEPAIEQEEVVDVIVEESVQQEGEIISYTVAPMEENISISINETVDSWSDYELLAHLIFAEAEGCTQDEMLWTGQVVLNRVDSQYFPNSIREVIFESGQYSTTWDGRIYLDPSQDCYDVAQLLMDGNRYIPSNVLFQTNGYLNYTLYTTTEHGLKFYTYGE